DSRENHDSQAPRGAQEVLKILEQPLSRNIGEKSKSKKKKKKPTKKTAAVEESDDDSDDSDE
ncbi:hypothetical protein QQS21_012647, partial [Conoideocrella luteorostrata]